MMMLRYRVLKEKKAYIEKTSAEKKHRKQYTDLLYWAGDFTSNTCAVKQQRVCLR